MPEKLTKNENELVLLGKQFGVKITKRSLGDNHVCIRLLSEDDESWYEKDWFSSYWLKDLIEVLRNASFLLETSSSFEDEIDEFGNKCGKRWRENNDNK